MHYSYNDIVERLSPAGYARRAEVTLGEHDTAEALVSTKWVFAGPGTVIYQLYPDGGWNVYPSETIWTVPPRG